MNLPFNSISIIIERCRGTMMIQSRALTKPTNDALAMTPKIMHSTLVFKASLRRRLGGRASQKVRTSQLP
jgi:hypothetical protein